MSEPSTDRSWMARALVLAERGRATVRPNPLVGCVLVRDGEVVGEGHHERPGGPHAEIVALGAAGDRAAGATAYVTLEPCDHTGRTGPCSRALLDAGVTRVVHALDDPNPVAAGGAARLEAAGVEVTRGVLADWAARQNDVFVVATREARPHLTLKLAQTADGALTASAGRWITGAVARTAVHRLRAAADAVMVGVGTVLADDPRLDVRHVPVEPEAQPRPVVLDTMGRTPPSAAVVRPGAVLLTSATPDREWRQQVEAKGAEVVPVAAAPTGLDLTVALTALARRGITAVLAEPGATLAAALVARRLVDRLVLHVAGRVPGPSGLPRMTPAVAPPAGAPWRWRTVASGAVGADTELVAVPVDAATPLQRSA